MATAHPDTAYNAIMLRTEEGHFESDGVCRCDCKQCSVENLSSGEFFCICSDCNIEECGMHDTHSNP